MLPESIANRRLVTLVIVIVVAILVVGILWWYFGGSSRSSNIAAPTNLSVSVSNATITLTWNGVGGATGYRVYVSTQSGVNFNQKGATYDVSQNTATLNLAPGTYYFRVSSLKVCGGRLVQSNTLSNEVNATTPSCPSSNLSTPSAVIVESEGSGTAEVSWQSVLDAASYNVYRAQGRLVTSTDYDQVYNTHATEVLFTGLPAGMSQSFLVTAQDGCGNQTAPSAAVQFTVDCNPPSSVEITQVTAGQTTITLNWAALAGVDTYVVYLQAGTWVSPGGYTSTAVLANTVLTHTFTGLTAGTAYAVAVAASSNSCGEGRLTVVGTDTAVDAIHAPEDSTTTAEVAKPINLLPSPPLINKNTAIPSKVADSNNAGQQTAKQPPVVNSTPHSGLATRGILSRKTS